MDTVYTKREEAGKALLGLLGMAMNRTEPVSIGQYKGFDLQIAYFAMDKMYLAYLVGSGINPVQLGADAVGNTMRLDNCLHNLPQSVTDLESKLMQLQKQLENAKPYWSWYGFEGRVEWCACFVSWCADQCGYIESGIIPKFAGCVDGANWFKGNGQWKDRSYEPSAGDIIFFDWEGNGETDHVGIVEKCENGVVYTVEGNSGDTCRQNQYTVGSSSIYGYGVPAY